MFFCVLADLEDLEDLADLDGVVVFDVLEDWFFLVWIFGLDFGWDFGWVIGFCFTFGSVVVFDDFIEYSSSVCGGFLGTSSLPATFFTRGEEGL